MKNSLTTMKTPKAFEAPEVIRSKGKSGAVASYRDNLLIPEGMPFPIELFSKLTRSGKMRYFDKKDHPRLQKELGFYTDLQSVKSEDGITWSLFGYMAHQSSEVKDRFFNELLSRLGCEPDSGCQIHLWKHLQHPDTGKLSGGPEMDVVLLGAKHLFLVECKWTSEIGKKQGVAKNTDQIEMRKRWIAKYGKHFYPGCKVKVLVAADEKLRAKVPNGELFISWDEFCSFESLPHRELFASYIQWKHDIISQLQKK